jgi:elongator complex protein 3
VHPCEEAPDAESRFISTISSELDSGSISTKDELARRKLEVAKELGLARVPRNSELLAALGRGRLDLLLTKPSRTASGVAVVAVMSSPEYCPHGRCTYCPGGKDQGTPQSYTGKEPSAMRGAQHGFDPLRITEARVRQLREIGHSTDKVDVIVMGGTFTARPVQYQESFVKGIFDGLNGAKADSLSDSLLLNERASSRCIGLTVETRPDWCTPREVDVMLSYGATRVELGVQTLNQETIDRVKRLHSVEDVADATKVAKDAGIKVGYHMMPGLPGETPESDLATVRKVFGDERYRPDLLKIYPTLVIEGTELHDDWTKGLYEPYDVDTVVELLVKVKSEVPPWVRISRIQRDIPAFKIEGGVKKGDVRELARARMRELGLRCRCIRCREAGRRSAGGSRLQEIARRDYAASGGKEVFLSVEDEEETLFGFARVRIPSADSHRPETRGEDGRPRAAFLRELRVLGLALPLGDHDVGRPSAKPPVVRAQHRGLGARLLAASEAETLSAGRDLLLVTSGVGVREYYRKHGYEAHGPYMGKRLR